MDNHIPLTPKNSGKINTATICNTNVLKKDIVAEVKPSFNAVKNPEVKMANPINKKHNENSLNPDTVRSNRSGECPTNIFDNGTAKVSAMTTIKIPTIAIIFRLFESRE